MYINRKDGTLVEAQYICGNCPHCGHKTNCDYYQFAPIGVDFESNYDVLNSVEFESQYGEAMICPDRECKIMLGTNPCPHRNTHICEDKGIITEEPPIGMGCPACIPYIPER